MAPDINVSVTSHYPIVSDSLRDIILTINAGVLGPSVALFGIVANAINIIIFVKIGFKENAYISLFCISVSDCLSLTSAEVAMMGINPFVISSGIPYPYLIIAHDVSGCFHVSFNNITGLLTAFIAFERCLNVVRPLQVKSIITKKTTNCVIVFLSVTVFCFTLQAYFWGYIIIVQTFDPDLNNRTITSVEWTDGNEVSYSVYYVFHSVTEVSSFVIVGVCSFVLVRTINQKSRWRQTASGLSGQNEKPSKDRQVVVIVTWISVIFIACSTPAVSFYIVAMTYSLERSEVVNDNIMLVASSVIGCMHAINSSVNIFIYLRMCKKYREKYRSLFRLPKSNKGRRMDCIGL